MTHHRGVTQIKAIVFDVNETLSDLRPLRQRFVEVGADEHEAELWFTALLRDGFALTSVGEAVTFAEIGRETLRARLRGRRLDRELDGAVEHVMAGFLGLGLNPDVPSGVRALRAAGLRLLTLSNGAVHVAERLLEAAGLRAEFEQVLSVDDAGLWKPAGRAYTLAVRQTGLVPDELLMVAVHPWDLHGASRAGLRTAWLDRDGGRYPAYFQAPDFVVREIGALVDVLAM